MKRRITTILYVSIFILIPFSGIGQTQIGQRLIGNSNGDQFGKSVAMSSDGNIVAVGAPSTDTNGDYSGQVSVYQFDGSNWNPLGVKIEAEASQDHSGDSVDLSDDGSILAIGAPDNDGNGTNSGNVRIYQYLAEVWVQIGQDIDGEASNDNFGRSVSLSADGQIVAVGADKNDGPGSDSGHVRVYQYTSGSWIQIGQTINGEAPSDWSGGSVSLSSNGTKLAIGAQYNDGSGFNAGHVRVFELIGATWSQMGADIDGAAANDNSGNAVSLSGNGNVIAIGAVQNGVNGADSGHVRVYQYSGNTWTQIGADINGDSADKLGFSVSLSEEGNILAVGAPHTSPGGGGKVLLFKYIGNVWSQVGTTLVATSSIDKLGTSVKLSLDGSKLVVGSSQYSTNGSAQIIDFSTALSAQEFDHSSFKLYPNPTSSLLNIEMGLNSGYDILIYNQLGQQVIKQYNLSGIDSIDVSKLTSGIYILETKTFEGYSQTIKFIKN